ncbi:hypothetical protein Hden_0287 [Hyphomicrobium denitrificans ATCC 51888]|uniref:Uncharacterized protein n=1 Tax=Hyphomicrobium denitrificans (strain ATCC 51888 / DSM 1869 / NCIMB 11706 / TK 0415) TaxID=582899 RepID=D8JQW0_HYPDA|nr:hypothetical protein Hden_0287 [Hyphomicrobium denitrificans ATCC 51888]
MAGHVPAIVVLGFERVALPPWMAASWGGHDVGVDY